MNLKTLVATSVIALSPMAKNAKAIAQTTPKTTTEIATKSNKLITRANKPSHAFYNISAGYQSKNILGQTFNEPAAKFDIDALSDNIITFRPSVTVGKSTYEVNALPLNFKIPIAKNLSGEVGANIAGIRGIHSGKNLVSQSELSAATSAKCNKVGYAKGEFFQDINAGVRFKNSRAELGVSGMLGRTASWDGRLSTKDNYINASNINKNKYKVVDNIDNGAYVGVKTDAKFYPIKNKGLYIGGDYSYSSMKKSEGSAKIGYTF